MHAQVTGTKLSHTEYLAREQAATDRHEFCDGVTYAMAGGTPEHGILAANVIYELRRLIGDRPCVVATSDVWVQVVATGLTTYPDVSVVCGPIERAADDANAMINPTLLVEVLSDGTEAYDRGQKFAHYRRIEALREYVLVSPHEPRIEVFRRSGSREWLFAEARAGERIALRALEGELAVDAVYRSVTLPAGPARSPAG